MIGGPSIQIPGERIEPIALEVASSKKTVAGILFALVFVFVAAAIGVATDGRSFGGKDGASTVGGLVFWFAILCAIGLSALRKARRATEAARLAKNDPSYTWLLSGRLVMGMDSAGVARPDLSFKISETQRTMLTAVPAARVVPPELK